MKKYLLIVLILFPYYSVNAQLTEAAWLLSSGVEAGAKALKNRGNKAGEFTSYFKAGQDSVAMKRTPEKKIRGDASFEIQKMEMYLSSVQRLYLQPNVESICPDSQTGDYLINTIRSRQPKWDIVPYQQELAFYKSEHSRRYKAAQLAEQQKREAIARRQQAIRDSVEIVMARRRAYTDSTRQAYVLLQQKSVARQDSIDESARQARAYELNRALLTDAGRRALDKGTAAKKPVAKKPAAKVATVYMCDSGNAVKYHASSNCRGLNRCNASVVRISKAEAQQSMNPCKFCY